MLSGVPHALARIDHSDFVCSRATVLALEKDALRTCFVVDTAPLLAVPSAPEFLTVATTNPVGQDLSWKAFACTHQLLDGVEAGALTIRDILGRP